MSADTFAKCKTIGCSMVTKPDRGFCYKCRDKQLQESTVEAAVVRNTHCSVHTVELGEGDICWVCERLGDDLRNHINAALCKESGRLMVVTIEGLTFHVPSIGTFEEAKRIFMSLDYNRVRTVTLWYNSGNHNFK